MTAIEWLTLGVVLGTLALVVVTCIYVWILSRQTKGIKKLTLEQIRYQVEGDITQVRLKRAEFLKGGDTTGEGKSEAMKIIDYRECQCTKTVNRIVEELGNMKKKDNWVTDPTLNWSEKTFHGLVFGFGFGLLSFVLKLLWDVTHRDIQGIGSTALVVVLMLLIIFSFFCISGRGVDTVEELIKRIKTAEIIKLWGFTIKGPPESK